MLINIFYLKLENKVLTNYLQKIIFVSIIKET